MAKKAVDRTAPLVRTIRERCKVCYTCIRECPAKAISFKNGQAEVIQERCIGCGNCVRVCSQGAKIAVDSIAEVRQLLLRSGKVAACLAPSFPVEFTDMDYRELCGTLRTLGFDYVVEVAAGADIVARSYRELLEKDEDHSLVATTCPAVVSYIEKYFPELIGNLVNIPSPMLVTALIVKELYGEDVQVVFIGPCIAKKREAERNYGQIPVDAVLTFSELRDLFTLKKISEQKVEPAEFDPPHPGKGMIFPLSEGLLQSSNLVKDLIMNNIVSCSGKKKVSEVVKEFSANHPGTRFLDILCCDGCIMGPGFTSSQSRYSRQACISRYAQERLKLAASLPEVEINLNPERLTMVFEQDDHRLGIPSREKIKAILKRMGKRREEDELNCGACGYETCLEHAVAIGNGFAENEMCLPYAIEKFKDTARELEKSYAQLEETQHALIQSEKLASMGQLAAGIAHEINNPLGIIVLYANLLFDECENNSEMYEDLKMIVEQANRCKTIVGGLLNFARKNKVLLKEADVVELLDNCIKMIRCPMEVKLIFAKPESRLTAELDLDQMTQVFINLFTNSIEAMPGGGELQIGAHCRDDEIEITISDTGAGIKEALQKKIFEPFFTTKQIGKGTGLGLAVSYGIIKMHHGKIEVVSNADPDQGPTGTTFIITLPRSQAE